jgi:hypothetical protein
MSAGGWSAGFSDRSHDGPSRGEAAAWDLAKVEVEAPRVARVLLFLLPSGRPRRRGDEGVATAVDAAFFPLPFGRPGPRFSGAPASPGALAARVATEVEGATVAAVTRASKVFLLRLPFGRPHFRDVGGIVSGAWASFSLLSGTLSPPAAEPLKEDMTGMGSGRRGSRRREKWGCALGHGRARHLKRNSEGGDTRRFGNRPHVVCLFWGATAAIATADHVHYLSAMPMSH